MGSSHSFSNLELFRDHFKQLLFRWSAAASALAFLAELEYKKELITCFFTFYFLHVYETRCGGCAITCNRAHVHILYIYVCSGMCYYICMSCVTTLLHFRPPTLLLQTFAHDFQCIGAQPTIAHHSFQFHLHQHSSCHVVLQPFGEGGRQP